MFRIHLWLLGQCSSITSSFVLYAQGKNKPTEISTRSMTDQWRPPSGSYRLDKDLLRAMAWFGKKPVTAQNELSIPSFVALQEIIIRHTVRVVISSIFDTLIFTRDNCCRRDYSLFTVGAGCIVSESEFELQGPRVIPDRRFLGYWNRGYVSLTPDFQALIWWRMQRTQVRNQL